MASFRKREDNTWEYRIRYKDKYTGKYKEKAKRGFLRKGDAIDAASKVELALSEGYSPGSENPLFSDYMNKWFEMAKSNYRLTTQFSREDSIARIKEKIGHIPIKDISADIITRYLQELADDDMSESTVSSDYVVIKKSIEMAKREKIIYLNPLDIVIKPKTKQRKPHRFWSLRDLDKFIEKQNEFIDLNEKKDSRQGYLTGIRDLTMICILAGCGTRVGELCGLLIDSYDQQTKFLKIHFNYVATDKKARSDSYERNSFTKTEAGYREVPVPSIVSNNIERWLNVRQEYLSLYHNHNDDGSMFPAPRRSTLIPPSIRAEVANIVKRYELPSINVHGFRHTYASFLMQSGVMPKQAQVLLGHKDVKTTLNIYTHVSDDDKQKAVNKLDDLLSGKMNKIENNMHTK